MDALEKLMIIWVHTTPNHQPPKMNVLQIILASNWLVGHSNTSPKQQQRPSILSVSSSVD